MNEFCWYVKVGGVVHLHLTKWQMYDFLAECYNNEMEAKGGRMV